MSTKSYLLEYDYVEGILEKRTPHRPEHVQLLQDLTDNNILVAAGPAAPPTKSFFYFTNTSKDIVEKFIKDDPYVKNDLVTKSVIHEWGIVIGTQLSKL